MASSRRKPRVFLGIMTGLLCGLIMLAFGDTYGTYTASTQGSDGVYGIQGNLPNPHGYAVVTAYKAGTQTEVDIELGRVHNVKLSQALQRLTATQRAAVACIQHAQIGVAIKDPTTDPRFTTMSGSGDRVATRDRGDIELSVNPDCSLSTPAHASLTAVYVEEVNE